MVNIKSTTAIVQRLLIEKPETRDSDSKLIAEVWQHQMSDFKTPTLESFFELFESSQLIHTESIRRCRQKWQQIHPELRGKTYKARKNNEPVVKDDLKNSFD